jgi:signal transduction histidine kinase
LKVKGSNNNGVWNEAGISLKIIIHPAVWQRLWIRVLFFTALLAIAFYSINHRLKRLRKEKQNQQIFSMKLIEAQENERKRIASELHDGLGQNLLIISNLAQVGLRNSDIDFTKKQLTNITENAQESIEEVRRIAHNLHPYQLDELGLSSALQSMLKKLSDTTSLNLSTYIENIEGYIKYDQ